MLCWMWEICWRMHSGVWYGWCFAVCSALALCLLPSGRWALLLPRPGERERELPCGLIYLQRAAVSERQSLCINLAVFRISVDTVVSLSIDSVSTVFSLFSSLSLPGSGMFDDGVYMYLIEPLQQTHSIVSYSCRPEEQYCITQRFCPATNVASPSPRMHNSLCCYCCLHAHLRKSYLPMRWDNEPCLEWNLTCWMDGLCSSILCFGDCFKVSLIL